MMAEQKERTFWHIQLHPDDPLPAERVRAMLERKHLIGVGEDKRGNAYVPAFQQTMAIGHIVLVRAGATPVALVEVVGDCVATDQTDDELDWFSTVGP